MATPESKVKAWLDKEIAKAFPTHVKVNPIAGPYGAGGVPDKLFCIQGRFVAIEVKAGAPTPTDLQWSFLCQIKKAGGVALCVGGKRWVFVADDLTPQLYDNDTLINYLKLTIAKG